MQRSYIRNFCIIAHIDHGKSTLADRFLQKAGLVEDRVFRDQILDSMDIERERGITIKSQAVRFSYENKENEEYIFNLVDTPGHVDFSYEVNRSISSCEGALLLVDASQGISAQTLANYYIAAEHELSIIPIINKIDLPAADIAGVSAQMEHEFGIKKEDIVLISAKQGKGIHTLFERIVTDIPPPPEGKDERLRAQIFDSHYDSYVGAVMHVRVFSGTLKRGMRVYGFAADKEYEIERLGYLALGMQDQEHLTTGEIGFFTANIKNISELRVGDTITESKFPCDAPLVGFKELTSYVYSAVFPLDADGFDDLTKGLDRLSLNDASLTYTRESSNSLGSGYLCGFLGLLHLEIIQERLEREFDLSVIFTAPTVEYTVNTKDGVQHRISQPEHLPSQEHIAEVKEPYIKALIICPTEYLGNIMNLCISNRGEQKSIRYVDLKRVELIFELPLSEILYEFYDRLKSLSRGYASFDYELIDNRPVELARLDILINGKKVDALSQLIFKNKATQRAREICKGLKASIPKHQHAIAIQGAIGGHIISRETISAFRKDVLAKCYGGDISRKRKLLEKQKKGKKRLMTVGDVEIPQKALLSVLKTSE